MKLQLSVAESFIVFATHDNQWHPILFDFRTGGFNVYHKEHQFCSNRGGGSAEKLVGLFLAIYEGKQVEFLAENQEHPAPDLRFDGSTWDVKYVNDANISTIRKYINSGRKADCLIFYWDNSSLGKLEKIKEASRRSLSDFRIKGKKMPSIYYINAEKHLKRLL